MTKPRNQRRHYKESRDEIASLRDCISELKRSLKETRDAATRRVAAAYGRGEDTNRLTPTERAVIEAALEWLPQYDASIYRSDFDDKLAAAVAALQKERAK